MVGPALDLSRDKLRLASYQSIVQCGSYSVPWYSLRSGILSLSAKFQPGDVVCSDNLGFRPLITTRERKTPCDQKCTHSELSQKHLKGPILPRARPDICSFRSLSPRICVSHRSRLRSSRCRPFRQRVHCVHIPIKRSRYLGIAQSRKPRFYSTKRPFLDA